MNAFTFIFNLMQVYYPGQSVSGSLQLVLKEPRWYQYAAISLAGKGTVRWSETRTVRIGSRTTSRTEHYSDKQTYSNLFDVIWGDKDATQPTRLDSGISNFPFQFTIPSNCPPTFKRKTGKIEYHLTSIVASQVKQYQIETPLVISTLVDLNSQPNLLQPFEPQSEKKSIIKCCCCDAGEAEVTFKMQRMGFCIKNDHIPITIECRNGSSEEITVAVKLGQTTTYKAKGHTKTEGQYVDIFSCDIPALTSDARSVNPNIPSFIKLGFKSNLIELSHSVSVWVTHVSDFADPSPAIETPVVIGNVPFRSNEEILSQQHPTHDQLITHAK